MNFKSAFALAAILALASPAAATVHTITAEFNESSILPYALNSVSIADTVIADGDTLDLTVTFTGGSITLPEGSAVWFGLLTGEEDALQTTSVLSFTDPSANILPITDPLTQTNIYVHMGNYFWSSLFKTGSGAFSFSTANQLMTLDSSGLGSRTYQSAFFFYEDVTGPTVLPEPATWAFMIAGFGMVGYAARRRRAAITA